MLELYPDHCEVIRDNLKSIRAVDEQTFASLEVLNDRLERVKKLGGRFAEVAFSPAAEHLRKQAGKFCRSRGHNIHEPRKADFAVANPLIS